MTESTIKKLGIDKKKLKAAPKISEILEYGRCSVKEAVSAMRFSDNDACKTFLEVYDKSSVTDRKALPIEAFAILADIDVNELLGAIIIAIGQKSSNIIKVMMPTHHPEIVMARIEYAKQPDGYRDRDSIDKAMGLLPVPKGATFNFDLGGARTQVESEVLNPEDIEEADIFPRLTETQKLLED